MVKELLVNETIELDVKEWEEYKIDVEKGDILHYVAREDFNDDFDIYIVHEEDVADHTYWTDSCLLEDTSESYYRGKYKFKNSGTFFFIVSNERAKSIARAIYIKLEIERTSTPDSNHIMKQQTHSQMTLSQFIHDWKIPIILILGTIILSGITYIAIPGLAYLVTFGGGAFLTMYYAYRKENQTKE